MNFLFLFLLPLGVRLNCLRFFFFFVNFYLCIWLCLLLVAARGFFVCRLLSHCGTWAPACTGFLVWCVPVECVCSVVAVCALHCPTACGILVPQSGIKPISPALEGRFLIIGPPGTSSLPLYRLYNVFVFQFPKNLHPTMLLWD